jgi:succinoglycan biosynthesis transport protein ExoP
MERLNSLTLRLRQLERAKEIIEVNYQLYLKKGEDLRIADDLDARKLTSVKIAAPALPPLSPAYPRKDLIIGISAFLGLLFGFAFCAAREYFSHTFKDDESVSAILGIPLLVSVPNMKQPSKRSGVNS